MKKVLILFVVLLLAIPGIVSATVTQHNFTSGSTQTIIFNGTGTSSWTPPEGVVSVEYLVVGGGGGSGGSCGAGAWSGGGGGSGGGDCDRGR